MLLDDTKLINPVCTLVDEQTSYWDLLFHTYKTLLDEYPKSRLLTVKIGPVSIQDSPIPEFQYVIGEWSMHVGSSGELPGVWYYLYTIDDDLSEASSRHHDDDNDNNNDDDNDDNDDNDNNDNKKNRNQRNSKSGTKKVRPVRLRKQRCYCCGQYGHHVDSCRT